MYTLTDKQRHIQEKYKCTAFCRKYTGIADRKHILRRMKIFSL